LKIVLEKGTGKSKITYRAQPEKAKSINEIIEHYNMMVAFFDRLFKQPIEGYLTDGAKAIEFSITENGKIVDLTDESHSIYNQIKRGDLEGVKIGASTHKRLVNVPFKITSKTTGESHIVAILVLSAAGITGVRIWNKKKQVKRLGIEEKKEEEE